MTTFKDIFVGTPQSNYAALAIVCAIIAICLSIVFNNSQFDFGERLAVIAIVVLFSIPSILLSLFNLTCIANNNVSHPYCGIYAWIMTIMIVIYCVIVIIASLMSMLTYNEASAKVEALEVNRKMSKDSANKLAEQIMQNNAGAANDYPEPPIPPVPHAEPQPPVPPAGMNMPQAPQFPSGGMAPSQAAMPAPEMAGAPQGMSSDPVYGSVEGSSVEPFQNSWQDSVNGLVQDMQNMPFKPFDMPFNKNKKQQSLEQPAENIEGFCGSEYATLQ